MRGGGPPEKVRALAPYGRALRDWAAGDREAELVLHSSLGEHEAVPVGLFFREPEELFPAERFALELCRGRVLDLGAGTGLHGVALAERGHEVTALELLPEAARLVRGHGLAAVRGDLMALPFAEGAFDTLLMLMNGIGPAGTLRGLEAFLEAAVRVLAPGGQLLVDSAEPLVRTRVAADAWPPPTPEAYAGEAWIRLEYRGETGPPFRELYVDAATLAERARAAGWDARIVFQDGRGGYLARLVPA